MFDGLKDMGKLLKQAKEMKSKMKDIQEELKRTKVTAQSKEGRILIEFTGELECTKVHIDAELLKPENHEKLQLALQKVINEGCKKSKDLATTKLSALSGDFNMPGLDLPRN